MTYDQLSKVALAEWQAVEHSERARVVVGTGTCGRAAGAETALASIHSTLAELNVDAQVTETGCLGLCYAEPLMELQKPGGPRVLYGAATNDKVRDLLRSFFCKDDMRPDMALCVMNHKHVEGIPAFEDLAMVRSQVRVVLRNCGIIDPANLNHYIARGGYAGLNRALGMKPEEVIAEVKISGLRGRGGAGFPTATKWDFCRKADGHEKYVICNADEGDPGAFMDRSVIEGDVHSVLEGMVIAGYAIGAGNGYIYVRAEYPLAIERLENAIKQAGENGLLGDNILGSGFSFQLRIKKGAGAFVCGEETALIASLEGKRGMPRARPPFPASKGLHDRPTNINNVETLANVPVILQKGGEAFAARGTQDSPGTKTFALAGKIIRTGLIEVEMGTTLRKIVFEIGGGIPDEREFKGVQTGGPSGGCIPASLLDSPVDYEHLAKAGAIMGSGGMVVMDSETCMVDVARYFVDFTQIESCGKCVPCRLGTRQMLQILTGISKGAGKPEDIELLKEIADAVKAGSLCGLGQTAPNPVLTTLRYYQDEYDAHVTDKVCPAGQCRELLTYRIDPQHCTGCGVCLKNCPADAIAGERKGVHVIDQSKCIMCDNCYQKCKFGAVIKE